MSETRQTEVIRLPSGRVVQGIVLERLHSGDRLVLWAGMEVWGRCLQPWEKPWRKEASE